MSFILYRFIHYNSMKRFNQSLLSAEPYVIQVFFLKQSNSVQKMRFHRFLLKMSFDGNFLNDTCII